MDSRKLDLLRNDLRSVIKFRSSALSVGVEHEFFLLGRDGLPSTHTESQELFRELSRVVQREGDWLCDPKLGKMMVSIVVDHIDGHPTIVKYDHHPHLIEIAFGWSESLDRISQGIYRGWQIVYDAIQKLGLIWSREPILELKAMHPRMVSEFQLMEKLRSYRFNLHSRRSEPDRSERSNYAARIAASQVHVGGLNWLADEAIIGRLYAGEAQAGSFAYSNISNSAKVFRERTKLYNDAFPNAPLILFPDIPEWTLDSWLTALCCSPMAGIKDARLAGRFPDDFDTLDLLTLWTEARDLQIIRPRPFGTVEFRGDAAQTSPEDLVALTAHRFRVAGDCSNGHGNPSLHLARKQWLAGPIPTEIDIL